MVKYRHRIYATPILEDAFSRIEEFVPEELLSETRDCFGIAKTLAERCYVGLSARQLVACGTKLKEIEEYVEEAIREGKIDESAWEEVEQDFDEVYDTIEGEIEKSVEKCGYHTL